jgi:hypothetical protein
MPTLCAWGRRGAELARICEEKTEARISDWGLTFDVRPDRVVFSLKVMVGNCGEQDMTLMCTAYE